MELTAFDSLVRGDELVWLGGEFLAPEEVVGEDSAAAISDSAGPGQVGAGGRQTFLIYLHEEL